MKEVWLWAIEVLMVLIPLACIVAGSRVTLARPLYVLSLRKQPSANLSQAPAQAASESDLAGWSKLGKTVAASLGIVAALTVTLALSTSRQWQESVARLLSSSVVMYGWVFWVLVVQLGVFLAIIRPRRAQRRILLLAIVCLQIAIVFMHNWVVSDLCTITSLFLFSAMLQPRMSFAKLSVILGIGATLYDAVQVYGTGNMVTRAEQIGNSPTGFALSAVVIPKDVHHAVFTISSHGGSSMALIGAGDILVSCLMAVSAGRVAQRTRQPSIRRAAYWGFVLASVCCLAVELTLHSAQPMTIYLVPCIGLLVVLSAWRKGVLNELLLPVKRSQPADPETPAKVAADLN